MDKLDMTTLLELYADLKKSIETFYSAHPSPDMRDVLERMALVDYFIGGQFKQLWYLERQIAQRSVQELPPSPIEPDGGPSYFG